MSTRNDVPVFPGVECVASRALPSSHSYPDLPFSELRQSRPESTARVSRTLGVDDPPMGHSVVSVPAVTISTRRTPMGAAPIFAASVRRAPGEPYVVNLRPGKKCLKCIFAGSVVVIAACAVITSLYFYYRLEGFERRVTRLELAVQLA